MGRGIDRRPAERPVRVPIAAFDDARGSLGVIETPTLPFPVQRLYFLHGLKAGVMRGRHGHKALRQVMICLAGRVEIAFWDGRERIAMRLETRDEGIYVPAGYWREVMPLEDGSILAVLASDRYDAADYIHDERSYLDFLGYGGDGDEGQPK